MSIVENQQVFARFEGGTVYTAEVGGKYLVLVNEAAMADLLDATDDVQQFGNTLTFNSSDERAEYLQQRYGQILAFQRAFPDD
jgi:hypothetical protein